MHRFYLGDGPLATVAAGDELRLGGEAAHRIARVLRLRAGDALALFGDGREFEGVLTGADGKSASVRLLAEAPPRPPAPALTLYQALIRPNRFEWLIEKGTEVGVSCFVPVVTDHTAVRASEIGAARLDRWRRIAVEATEQCGRRRPPRIAPPMVFGAALEAADGIRVFAWQGAPPGLGRLRWSDQHPRAEPYALFVGPEGGWSAAEFDAARAAGAELMGLGTATLRAETAAIVGAALLLLC